MKDTYAVKEIFKTIQGEGCNAGRAAIFVRFIGCNLWNGDPLDRASGKGACASWCDTDFRPNGGLKLSVTELVRQVRTVGESARLVVLTGGEPLLQVDQLLISALNSEGYAIAIETNGTIEPKFSLSHVWTCVSPKKSTDGKPLSLAITRAEELKVILGGTPDWTEEELSQLSESGSWGHRWVHPADPITPNMVGVSSLTRKEITSEPLRANIKKCLDWVHIHPRWRMGFQIHKVIDVP